MAYRSFDVYPRSAAVEVAGLQVENRAAHLTRLDTAATSPIELVSPASNGIGGVAMPAANAVCPSPLLVAGCRYDCYMQPYIDFWRSDPNHPNGPPSPNSLPARYCKTTDGTSDWSVNGVWPHKVMGVVMGTGSAANTTLLMELAKNACNQERKKVNETRIFCVATDSRGDWSVTVDTSPHLNQCVTFLGSPEPYLINLPFVQ